MLLPPSIFAAAGVISGADPGFEKGGGAVASGARSENFFGQFRGLFKKSWGSKGWACAPS